LLGRSEIERRERPVCLGATRYHRLLVATGAWALRACRARALL